ncbi:MAG: TIGR02757 family protein, partial [Flavobacteriaceae bacterium]
MNSRELKDFLEAKVEQYHQPEFLKDDPICIPHHFERKEDIEISGFLTATIAWGNRKSIIKSAKRLMELMEWEPYRYIMGYHPDHSEALSDFVHRTFNGEDLACFINALKHLYTVYGGLEPIFARYETEHSLQPAIAAFKRHFFEREHPQRSMKHISDPEKGSAAKRINMFLRWMIRDNSRGVDFGLWQSLHPSQLSCPLDVHSGRVARK